MLLLYYVLKLLEETVMEYDLSKCKQMFSNVAITIALSGFLYYKFQIIKPLAIQSIFAIKNLLEQPLVMIHLFFLKLLAYYHALF